MSETILTGYLIKKTNYDVFDEIITFIIPSGKKIVCLSRGSKKIESKNARNLFLGSEIEFEIFQSRSDDKISKLKKAHLISALDWNYETLESFNLLNEIVNKVEQSTSNLFIFYESILKMIKNNIYDQHQLILIILQMTCKLLGTNLQVNCCVKCGNNKIKTISFKQHGMLCNLCFDPKNDKLFDLSISKLFHNLFNEKYHELAKYINEWTFAIKLLKQFIADNTGLLLNTLINY